MTEKSSRRSVLKGVAATGTAATGLAAFGGQAAGQQTTNVNANQLFATGLIVVQGVNIQDVVDISDVTVNILNDSEILKNIDIDVENIDVLNNNVIRIEDVLSDIDIQNVLNNNAVQVSVLSGGSVVGTDTVRVPGNLR